MAKDMQPPQAGATPPARRSDPFQELRGEMDRLFDSFLGRGFRNSPTLFGQGSLALNVDVKETGDSVVVEAEVPGMEDKDITVTLREGVLTIKGEKKTERNEDKDNYHVSERSFGSFERSLRLPDTIDEERVEAHVEKGVLRVVAPKNADAVKPARTIPIGKK